MNNKNEPIKPLLLYEDGEQVFPKEEIKQSYLHTNSKVHKIMTSALENINVGNNEPVFESDTDFFRDIENAQNSIKTVHVVFQNYKTFDFLEHKKLSTEKIIQSVLESNCNNVDECKKAVSKIIDFLYIEKHFFNKLVYCREYFNEILSQNKKEKLTRHIFGASYKMEKNMRNFLGQWDLEHEYSFQNKNFVHLCMQLKQLYSISKTFSDVRFDALQKTLGIEFIEMNTTFMNILNTSIKNIIGDKIGFSLSDSWHSIKREWKNETIETQCFFDESFVLPEEFDQQVFHVHIGYPERIPIEQKDAWEDLVQAFLPSDYMSHMKYKTYFLDGNTYKRVFREPYSIQTTKKNFTHKNTIIQKIHNIEATHNLPKNSLLNELKVHIEPLQGYKIHLGCNIDEVIPFLELVNTFVEEHKSIIPGYKVATAQTYFQMFWGTNDAKLITLYPRSIENARMLCEEFEKIFCESQKSGKLKRCKRHTTGEVIFRSDAKNLSSNCISYRYGAFREGVRMDNIMWKVANIPRWDNRLGDSRETLYRPYGMDCLFSHLEKPLEQKGIMHTLHKN